MGDAVNKGFKLFFKRFFFLNRYVFFRNSNEIFEY
jgi:hypothetical protein